MRVLVTGDEGKIGTVVATALRAMGHEVVGFDIRSGRDMRDAAAVREAARGCGAIVHLAAVPGDLARPHEVLSTNVLGTRNVLEAARARGPGRVVVFSSVNALGIFRGERPPDYLPIDDDHPPYPETPYGMSKLVGEQLSRLFTAQTGITTVCLRPPGVLAPEDYERIREQRRATPSWEWEPMWEYGAFVDVRDVAGAVVAALTCPDPGHATVLLCADDISATEPGRDLARRILPDVPWRGGPEYDEDPWRALVDSSRARAVLGWRPMYRWRDA